MAKLALITVLYRSDQVLEDFLSSLSRQQFVDFHLYMVDNSVNPITDALIKRLLIHYPLPGFTHIKNEHNVGAARGNNQGIQAALASSCTHLLLLNNDIVIESPSLLNELMHCSESIIVPKLLYYDTRQICMAGGYLSNITAKTVHIGAGEIDRGQYDQSAYFNYAPTTFMLLVRRVFQEVGFLDERYFAYYEDTDFIYRATQKGYHVFYQPNLVVLHKESSLTGGLRSPFFIYYINRNRLYFIRKHFKRWPYFRAMASMGLDFLRMFRHYTNKQRKILIKAIWHGVFKN